jgi:hypothetical protein
MEYTTILPDEPKGPLWDRRGQKWELWFDGFWRLAGPDDMCPIRWGNLPSGRVDAGRTAHVPHPLGKPSQNRRHTL